jgi:hypothetical protein
MATHNINDTSAHNAAADFNTSNHLGVAGDSNLQSTGAIGEPDHLVLRTGGADDQQETNQGPGKTLL